MIRTVGLTKVYKGAEGDFTALQDVSIHIEKGDIFGIIGRSGAGKSTLLRCLGLLETPSTGNVEIFGRRSDQLTRKERLSMCRKIGTIFQGYSLLMQRNVEKNIAFPLELQHASRTQIKKRTAELLELIDLPDKALAYPSQLSGGQKQRVAIARALATNPDILLCDEPTSALDSFTTKSILNLLAEINRRFGVTIVIITHEMGVVSSICNKTVVLDNNHVVEQGSTKTVMHKPKSPVTKLLLGVE